MPDRKFKAPNGTVVTETELRSKYGAEFDNKIKHFTLIEDQEVSNEPQYKTPNNKIVPESELKAKYGDRFESVKSNFQPVGKSQDPSQDGGLKSPQKKSESQSTTGSAEFERLVNLPRKSTQKDLEEKVFKAERGRSTEMKTVVKKEVPISKPRPVYHPLKDISKINQDIASGKSVDEVVQDFGEDYRQDVEKYYNLKTTDFSKPSEDYSQFSGLMSVVGEDGVVKDKDNTVETLYSKSELYKNGFDPADFDGYLEKKGLKQDLRRRINVLGDESARSGDIGIQFDQQRLKDFNNYYNELMLKKSAELASTKVAANLGNEKAKEAYNRVYNEIINYEKGYSKYVSENFQNVDKLNKENRQEFKKQYDDYKKGNGSWFSSGVQNTWNNIDTTVGNFSAFVYDKLGANNIAEGIRMSNEEDRTRSTTGQLYYAYEEGKKGEFNGSNYIVTKDGRILDTDIKLDVTDALDDSDYNAIVDKSSSWKEDSSFSLGGAAQQITPVLADMAIQIALTRGMGATRQAIGTALTESTTLGNVSRQLAKTSLGREGIIRGGLMESSVVNKLSKIPAHYADVMIAQSTYGYANGYETALSTLKKAGYTDNESKELAANMAEQMAVLYGSTALINPQAKLFQTFEKKSMENLVRTGIESMKTEGKQGFIKTIGDGVKNMITTQNAKEVLEEAGKEVVQENIQQIGETTVVNRNMNEEAGKELFKQDYTVKDFINTSAISLAAGVMMNSPLMARGVDKLNLLSQLSGNRENFEKSLDNYVSQGLATKEQASRLKNDVDIFTKYQNKIPAEVPNDVAWDIMVKLDDIDQEIIKKNNSHEMFKDAYNQRIDVLKTEVNEIMQNKGTTEIEYPGPQEVETSNGKAPTPQINEEVDEQITESRVETAADTSESGASWSIEEGDGGVEESTGRVVADAKKRLYEAAYKFTSGDKAQAVTDLNDLISTIDKSGVATKSQIKSMTRGAMSIDPTDRKAVDKYLSKMEGMIDKINNKSLITSVEKSRKKSRKLPKTLPSNIREVGIKASKIPYKYLSPESLKQYGEMLNKINTSSALVQGEKQSMVNTEEVEAQLEVLHQEIEQAKIQEIKDDLEDLGIDFKEMGMSDADLKTFWEVEVDSDISEDKAISAVEKAEQLRGKLQDVAERFKGDLNDVKLEEGSDTPQMNKVLAELKKAPLELMSAVALKDYVRVVQNISVNEDLAGAGKVLANVQATNRAVDFIKQAIKRGVDIGKITLTRDGKSLNFWNDAKSMALLLRQVFKTPELMGEFNHYSGLADLSSGRTQAEHKFNDIVHELDGLFKELGKSGKKNLKRYDNTTERGIVSNLIQGDGEEDLQMNKTRVEDHIKSLKDLQTSPRQVEMVQEIYDEYRDFTSQQEVLDHLKSKNDGNYELVKFWQDKFEDIRQDLKNNTEFVHNEIFKELLENYLPIRRVQAVRINEDANKINVKGVKSAQKAGSTISRTNTRLAKGERLDLDFDKVMSSVMKQNLSDIHTSQAVNTIREFFRYEPIEKTIGYQNVAALAMRINYMQDLDSGVLLEKGSIEKALRYFEKMVRKVAITAALGSVTAAVKQSIPVVASSMVQTGSKGTKTFFTRFREAQNNDLVAKYSTSLRGETLGGELTTIDKVSDVTSPLNRLGRVGEGIKKFETFADKVRGAVMKPLSMGDSAVAKASWVAYYMEYLEKNGVDISKIGSLDEESKLVEGDELRQRAASYAEVRIEESQVASDSGRAAPMFNNPHIGMAVIRSVVMAYQQFNANAKFRMMQDLRILVNNTRKANGDKYTEDELLNEAITKRVSIVDKLKTKAGREAEVQRAWKSLTATVVEQAAFQGIKAFVLVYLSKGISTVMKSIIGVEDDEEPIDLGFKTKQFLSNMLKDINPLVIGTLAEDYFIDGLNWVSYLTDDEDEFETYTQWEKSKKKSEEGLPFYRYNKKGQDWGVYSGAMDIAQKGYENFKFIDGEAYVTDDYGNESKVELEGAEADFLRFMFLMECLRGTTGVEADTYRELEKIRKEIIKNNK